MTDVSAGALAAGGSALKGSGQVSATDLAGDGPGTEDAGTSAGFADELNAIAETPGGKHGKSLEVLLSKSQVPIAALYNKLSDINPGQAFHQGGLLPGTKISTEGLLENGLPGLPGSETAGGEAIDPAQAGEEAGGDPTDLPDPEIGVEAGSEAGGVLPEGEIGEMAEADGAADAPVEQAAEEVTADQPPVDDGTEALAAIAPLPVAPVVVEELSEPLIAADEGGEISATVSITPAALPTGPEPVEGEASPATLAAQTGPAAPAADETAQQASPTERRWQSELPKELRSPDLALGAPQAQSQTEAAFEAAVASASGAVAETGEQPATGAAGSVTDTQVGTPAPQEDDGKVTGLERALQATANASEMAREALTKERGAGGKPTLAELAPASMTDMGPGETAGGGAQASSASGPAGAVSPGRSPAMPAPGDGATMDMAATGGDAAAEGTLTDEVVAKGAGTKDAVTGEAGTVVNRPEGSEPQVRQAPRLAARIASELPPALSAIAASGLASDDADQPLSISDLALTGEIGATTVRGGEIGASMRTESLQAPNQSQSAHAAAQVAAEIARNLKNGQTRFHMRFDPPELGRVEVNMKVHKDGTVHAHLIVDRRDTLDLFLRDQRGLERALEAAGLNPDSSNMQFSLKQDGGQQFASGGDGFGQEGPMGGEDTSAPQPEADPMVEEIVRMRIAEQRGGLDLKI